MTSHFSENQLQRENATGPMLAQFDVYGLYEIISAEYSPRDLIFTTVTSFSIMCTADDGAYNYDIKGRIFTTKAIQT